MAYTKAPVNDTHNVVRYNVAGENFVVSNEANSVFPTTLNYINCFPLKESQWHTDPKASIHKREAWLKNTATGTVTAGATCPRMTVPSPDFVNYPNVFFTKASTYYRYSAGAVTAVTTSTTAGQAAGASGTDAVDNSNARRICFLDPMSELKTFLLDGTSVTTTAVALNLDGTKGLVFLNGYLFAVDNTGYKIFNSGVGGNLTSWSATDYISAEQYADPVRWIDKHKNYLVTFGSNSIEFFYDGGVEVGSPLVRQESYARKIGIYIDSTGTSNPGKATCRIDDDIYFLGLRDNDNISLYRIRNFQVEEIEAQYLQNVVNSAGFAGGIETVVINNNPMVLINGQSESYSLVYFPKENSWWQITQGQPGTADFPAPQYRLGTAWYDQSGKRSTFLAYGPSAASTEVYYYVPDSSHTQSVTATMYSNVWDQGINYWKHIARIDAIGDFGNNVLTLSYNGTPNYAQTYTSCTPTRQPSVAGYGYNASWFNLGAFRRMSFKLELAGTSHAILDGMDIEYNVGAA